MNVAVTTVAEGFPRPAFTADDIARMIEAGIIGEDEKFEPTEENATASRPRNERRRNFLP